ncbi:MAG: hypothetical protein AB1631_30530 [Acidobacteriota bacterium]
MAQAQRNTQVKANPITTDPTGLLFGEACLHLSHNLFIRLVTNWWMMAVEFIAVGLLIFYAPAVALDVLLGCGISFVLLATAYMIWYGRFVRRNSIYKPLCPHCTSRIWQLSCGRCREAVPALALWAWGAFLTHCPHCDFRLSARKRTLLAWCSTCLAAMPRPDILLNKPTHIIVWVATSLPKPNEVKGGWEILREDHHTMTLYQDGGKRPALLMFIRDDYKTMGDDAFEEYIKKQTRLLLISKDVVDEHAGIIEGQFSRDRTLFERVSPIK